MSGGPVSSDRRGFSLVEILIAVILLSLVALGLALAATLGLSQVGKAGQDLKYSADVQQVADSLVAAGYNSATSGSESIRGRAVYWTVSQVSAKSRQIEMVVQRRGMANTGTIYSDTVRLYLAKP
ncbi:MAG TPA: prepilin-type N-terminal cleavage/methylation domain-containing protein [Blastocatellia bacterium]|nr:prepilin-type N-terminal cleavage/methylation domain-containing protein [Blastocatellia bacterium]